MHRQMSALMVLLLTVLGLSGCTFFPTKEPLLSIQVVPNTIIVDPGETVSFVAIPRTRNGKPLDRIVEPVWEVTGDIGSLAPSSNTNEALFTAGASNGSGFITATVGQMKALATVRVHPRDKFHYSAEMGYPDGPGRPWAVYGGVSHVTKDTEQLNVNGGILTVNTMAAAGHMHSWWISPDKDAWSAVQFSDVPLTIEMRLRVVDQVGSAALALLASDGSQQALILIGKDRVGDYMVDATEWHTYRFDIVDGRVDLYIDGSAEPQASFPTGPATVASRLNVGDSGSGWSGHWELEYFTHLIPR